MNNGIGTTARRSARRRTPSTSAGASPAARSVPAAGCPLGRMALRPFATAWRTRRPFGPDGMRAPRGTDGCVPQGGKQLPTGLLRRVHRCFTASSCVARAIAAARMVALGSRARRRMRLVASVVLARCAAACSVLHWLFLRVAPPHAACCIGCCCALRRRSDAAAHCGRYVYAPRHASEHQDWNGLWKVPMPRGPTAGRVSTQSTPIRPYSTERVPRVPPRLADHRELPVSAGAGGRWSTPGWCPDRSKPLERSHPR